MSSGIYNQYTGYHNRRSIRLPRYDYSRPGYYFVTICIHNRKQNLFGDFSVGIFVEIVIGRIVRDEWIKTGIIRPNVILDEFVIMPNHFHGIIRLTDCRYTARRVPTTETSVYDLDTVARRAPATKKIEQFQKPTIGSIPTIVRAFKSAATKQIHTIHSGFKWQRNYFEHIIRDEKSLFFIRKYIRENPVNWVNDPKKHIDREVVEFHLQENGRQG